MQNISTADDRFQSVNFQDETDLALETFIRCHAKDSSLLEMQRRTNKHILRSAIQTVVKSKPEYDVAHAVFEHLGGVAAAALAADVEEGRHHFDRHRLPRKHKTPAVL